MSYRVTVLTLTSLTGNVVSSYSLWTRIMDTLLGYFFFVVFVVCSYEVSGKSDGNPGEYYRMFHLVTQSAYW